MDLRRAGERSQGPKPERGLKAEYSSGSPAEAAEAGSTRSDVHSQAAAGFDVAGAYYAQRHAIAADKETLQRLVDTVGARTDLTPHQWAQWYAMVMEFRPSLILELGRGHGNSTALFCQALSRLGKGRVVSLCFSSEWETSTRPKLAGWLPDEWFGPLDARTGDILAVDFAQILGEESRILLLWDAHGFEVASAVLGTILPQLVGRPHLVLMHDISDARHLPVATRSYAGNQIWQGAAWQERTRQPDSRVRIGWMDSCQNQVIAIADFTSRNELELGSADHDFHAFFDTEVKRQDMLDVIGSDLFSMNAHWAYLQLPDDGRELHFPPAPPVKRSSRTQLTWTARRYLRSVLDSSL